MFSQTLQTVRKNRGMTQEELATRLNVTRQTVSKWEKGLSVPDAELLVRISEILETDVETLLGAGKVEQRSQSELAEQLARINEQLAVKNRRSRRIWRTVGIVLIAVAAFWTLLIVLGFAAFTVNDQGAVEHETIETVEE